jgi:hypothetical protein
MPAKPEAERPLPLWKILAEEFTNRPSPLAASLPEAFAAEFTSIEKEFASLGGTLPDDYPALKARALELAAGPDTKLAEEAFLAAFLSLIHALPVKRSCLCFSGGGIRSATFGLGVLQGLARAGVLNRFHYLSTVSGGGYLGGWFSAWIHWHPQGRKGVIQKLQRAPESKIDPEPRPLRHLRAFSNYLNPRLGLFSADTWTLVATVLRNVILNWLVLLPLLGAALLIPRLCSDIPAFNPSVTEVQAALVLGFVFAALAVAYIVGNLPSFGDRRGTQKQFLAGFLLPLVLAAICLTNYWAWGWRLESRPTAVWQFVLFGIAIHCAGWLRCAFPVKRGEGREPWRCPPRRLLSALLAAAFTGSIGGLLAWAVFTHPLREPINDIRLYGCAAVPALLAVLALAGALLVGATSKFTCDDDREWWARGGGWILIAAVVWLASATLGIYGPDALRWLFHELAVATAAAGGLSGIISIWLGRSSKTFAAAKDRSPLADIALKLAAPVFSVFLVASIALGADELVQRFPDWLTAVERSYGPLPVLDTLTIHFPGWFILLALTAVGLIAARYVDANEFSLHAMYRNRLVRAYLGASHEDRHPNRFTGFDPEDDIPLHNLKPEAPLHVVNVTLNLVAKERLAWQQRKAESFTMTRLHSGSYRIGYRNSSQYGAGVSLGTAVTISGAAASPNMGYHSSTPVAFLMTLFNARLGCWLGNPGPAGRDSWNLRGPNYAVHPMLDEAFGLTTDTSASVYLSDGGHFENLGLYEMILRRCHFIVVVDASCDPKYNFEDLGNAVRKIRIDFGVPIEFVETPLKDVVHRDHCAVATVKYRAVDPGAPNGTLVYIKPVLTGDEPADVANYASSDKTFPHQSTADQWFDEAQFESYRRLGLHSIEEILKLPALENR